jgi:propanol-preferring alcohol dehydrogenase
MTPEPDFMDVWVVDSPAPVTTARPLVRRRRAVPEPGPGEVQVRVEACAVCRTDLHLAEGDLQPRRPQVVPGHEVVGTVSARGAGAARFADGDRIGLPWLRRTCGTCEFCLHGKENLCSHSQFTGWDADGGFAEYAVIDERFAYALPPGYSSEELAPMLCAGIIGFRALRLADLPPGGRLGIYGFGASAHLTLQVALAAGATVHVLTRSAAAQELALKLGAASAGNAYELPPEPVESAILFAPVGDLVPTALEGLRFGGTLAIAGIHLSRIPPLDYDRHLFRERTLRSVTANTRADGEEFLRIAAEHRLHVVTSPYPFDRADRALADLANDAVDGAAVLLREGHIEARPAAG